MYTLDLRTAGKITILGVIFAACQRLNEPLVIGNSMPFIPVLKPRLRIQKGIMTFNNINNFNICLNKISCDMAL